MPALKPEQFPSLNQPVRAKWAPIFLSPVLGSPERLVIGVVAVNGSGFHIERANALRRFECLYGAAAETAIFAAELALDELEADCAGRGMDALTDPHPGFSGVSIGNVSEGEAPSLAEIARTWMTSLSSLHDADKALALEATTARELVDLDLERTTERLPSLVLDYVKNRRAGLERFFNEDIRDQRERRRRSKVHGVIIDFSGSHLVANFGTLRPLNRATSVDRIKRRMWDLKVNRDTERGTIATRTHEMIVQHPTADDPQVTERQYTAITEAISDLSEQAQKEEISFTSMTNVAQIGDHVLAAEAA